MKFKSDLPFDVVPDPEKQLYRNFGIDRSIRSVLHPSAWLAAVRGWSPKLGLKAGAGGHFGMPAEFLIASDGTVLASKYGAHANDHWDVGTVLNLTNDVVR